MEPCTSRGRVARSNTRRSLIAILVAIAALACSAGVASAAITIVNPGFETGTMAGWTGGSVTTVLNGQQTSYTAKSGQYFGVASANGCNPQTLQQTFTADAGDRYEGYAFFLGDDYLPYNDNGSVKITVVQSGTQTTVFSSSVAENGNYGGTPWTDFSFQIPSTGSYTVAATANNVGDCALNSYVGLDSGPANPSDFDHDGVDDLNDNCGQVPNANQADADHDGVGDACDKCPATASGVPVDSSGCPAPVVDADGDGKPDSSDNCPNVSNANQLNTDGDSMGDACDPDDDNDGVLDGADNCAGTPAGTQVASDGCPDPDGDGKSTNAGDNCPNVSNADQANNDGDSLGDACDPDDDNDGVADTTDNCQFVSNMDQYNNDADSQGDACDSDDDNDGVADTTDNCQFAANPTQRDSDGDHVGDACDGTFNSTDGKTSGGGYVMRNGQKVNFSVSGKSDAGKLSGTCVVTVGTTKIKCLDADGFYKSTTNDRIVMVGPATVDGVTTRYRIELTDNGEPGTSDRIEISTDSGFLAAGTIGGGNLQVFK